MSRRLQLSLLTTFAGLCGAAAAIALLYALAQPQLRARWDLTGARQAGLSSRTVQALRALPEDSRVTAFLFPERQQYRWYGSAVYPQAHDRLRSLLEDARVESGGRVEVVVLDAGTAMVERADAAERLDRQPGETLVLESGEDRRVLRFDELFQVVQPREDGQPARIRGERVDRALGDAALALAAGERPRVGIVTGSGQPGTDDPQGLQPLVELIERESWEAVTLAGPSAAGEDLDLLLVAGQPRPMLPADREAVDRWLAAGRPLLLALGPFAPREVVARWNERLAERGTGFEDGLVCEPVRDFRAPAEGTQLSATLELRGPQLSGQHPITAELSVSDRALLFAGARPVRHESGTNEYTQARLLRTTPEAWVDRPDGAPFTRDPREERGIRALAVATERWSAPPDGGRGRAVVIGSAQSLYGRELVFQVDFLRAALRWLMELDDEAGGLVSVRELPFRPTRAQQESLARVAVYGIPGLTLLTGLLVWWRRRR